MNAGRTEADMRETLLRSQEYVDEHPSRDTPTAATIQARPEPTRTTQKKTGGRGKRRKSRRGTRARFWTGNTSTGIDAIEEVDTGRREIVVASNGERVPANVTCETWFYRDKSKVREASDYGTLDDLGNNVGEEVRGARSREVF